MKRKILMGLTTIGLLSLLFTGCSKLPQTDIDATNAAIEEAKTAGADIYLPAEFIALQDSMKAVMEGIETQKSKMFKKYGSAKEDLGIVSQLALQVKQKTEVKKEELKVEIENIITQVNTLLAENKQLVAEAPKGKEGTTALLAIKDEISVVEASVAEASTMLQAGDYMNALNKVNTAKDKASSINAELKQVIAKYKTASKGKK